MSELHRAPAYSLEKIAPSAPHMATFVNLVSKSKALTFPGTLTSVIHITLIFAPELVDDPSRDVLDNLLSPAHASGWVSSPPFVEYPSKTQTPLFEQQQAA